MHVNNDLNFYLQQILIDARGHLLGRLSSIVAKAILSGKFPSACSWRCVIDPFYCGPCRSENSNSTM